MSADGGGAEVDGQQPGAEIIRGLIGAVAPQTGFWGEVEAFTGHPDDAGDQPVPLGLQCVGGQGKDLVKPDLLAPAVAVLGRQGGDRLVSLAARQLGGSSAWHRVLTVCSRVGWLALSWAMNVCPASCAHSKVFLTVERVGRDHAFGQAEFAQQDLDGRDLAVLGADLDMAEDQPAGDLKGADQVNGGAILEVVEAAAQRLAVESDDPHALGSGLLGQQVGMEPKDPLQIVRCEGAQDQAHRGLGRRSPPAHSEGVAQPLQVNVHE